jgi:hypothetical protein
MKEQQIVRYVSKEMIKNLRNWNINLDEFIRSSRAEKGEYAWWEGGYREIPIKIIIPEIPEESDE